MAGITVGMIDGLMSRSNGEWLDTGNVVSRYVLFVLAAYAGTAWVHIGFGEKHPDWLSVVIPLDGDIRSSIHGGKPSHAPKFPVYLCVTLSSTGRVGEGTTQSWV